MSEFKSKDRWDKAEILGKIFLIPVIIIIISYFVQSHLKSLELRTRTIDIAVSILSTDPERDPQIQPLREWAVRVIDEYSELELSNEAREALLTNQVLIHYKGDALLDNMGRILTDERGRPITFGGDGFGVMVVPDPAKSSNGGTRTEDSD